jgi:hypothetical protein
MVDRLRALLDRPLDPRVGRAIVLVAAAISLGFASVVVLAGSAEQGIRSASGTNRGEVRTASGAQPGELQVKAPASVRHKVHHRQDPQDERGSAAGRRAESALRTHRALQHVPYHRGGVTITLKGARHGRAVLLVRAQTLAAERRGWRSFLQRFSDSGNAYLPDFKGRRAQR